VEAKIPTFDDLSLRLQSIGEDMTNFAQRLGQQSPETYFPHLKMAVDRVGTAFPTHPTGHPRYRAEWSEFVEGWRDDPDSSTIRCLCWEPDIATTKRFVRHLQESDIQLTARPLAGLVRSCHLRWDDGFSRSETVAWMRHVIIGYGGPSPVILKWKSKPDAILSAKGPEMLALSLVEQRKTLPSLLGEWYLDEQSLFTHRVVEEATSLCGDRLARPTKSLLRLLFGELLQWPLWDPESFRREVVRLILGRAVTGQARNILQAFIMANRYFGDPRTESNRPNWSAVPGEALKRVTLWLSENPFHLQQHVYREGKGWTVSGG
jgi:hypothetical protein